jgi:hypothetical protein
MTWVIVLAVWTLVSLGLTWLVGEFIRWGGE